MACEWQDSLDAGGNWISSRHEELSDVFRRLLAACSMGTSQVALAETIAYLEQYISLSLNDEEALMMQAAYPEIAQQKREHMVFRRQAECIIADYYRDGSSILLVAKVSSILSSWLLTHVGQEDSKLILYLHSMNRPTSVEEKGDL